MKKRSTLEDVDIFLSSLNGCANIEHVIALLTERMTYLGFEKSAYWLRWPQLPEKPNIILSTYPPDFVGHYKDKDYGTHDMVGRYSTNTNTPFTWSDIEKRFEITQKQRIIFHESSSAGLKVGASVPIHGPNMTKATFSVASDLPAKEFNDLFLFHRHEIHLLATGAHERLMQLGLGNIDAIQPLSARETEIILWISRGYTYGEISQRLIIQDDTVKKHMQSIFRKLGATNGPHAAAIAIVHGLIVP